MGSGQWPNNGPQPGPPSPGQPPRTGPSTGAEAPDKLAIVERELSNLASDIDRLNSVIHKLSARITEVERQLKADR